ncbi:MAG: flagellar basal-body rod protein FlgB [Urechidicola sp.]|jgi:flagellar basal-body rod protein FlgB
MPINFERAFAIHDDAMIMRGKRASVLASNIANADTPNYKARDIDFQSMLKQANNQQTSSLNMVSTHHEHINLNSASHFSTSLKYRNPLHASLDGNTVDSHVEQSKFSENALQYQTSFTFLNGSVKGIIKALKGE